MGTDLSPELQYVLEGARVRCLEVHEGSLAEEFALVHVARATVRERQAPHS